ncbi:UNVERIFIED_CONTAM: Guanylate kinase [Sesamum latifolium]|uniref:Guanylate kinase n=1 Tax=Sesamum latifolium TaxID=2727402 RepID=A0AAW2XGJ7_9LAMI
MGEAPAFVVDNLNGNFTNGLHSKSKGCETAIDIGNKTRCILDIDVQGARSVRASSLEAIFIFICPPSFEELEKRLRARGTESEEQIQKRLRNAKAELEQRNSPGLFDHILVNDDLDTCYEKLKKLLGLADGVKSTQESVLEPVHVSLEHTVSKTSHKILINCGAREPEKPAKNMFVLDLASMKGGAPARTRGLRFYTLDPSSNGVDAEVLS